jgi:predicted TIM-barrel fold metal-dependent hydrolase
MQTDWRDLRLSDYRPRSMARLAETRVPRATTPAIDMHCHLGRWDDASFSILEPWQVEDVPRLVGIMDDCNVETVVNLDGCWGDELEKNFDRFDRAFPGRFATFCRVNWLDCQKPGWPERLAESIRDSARRGARGFKLTKDVGLRDIDEHGERFFLDDPRLDPLWNAISETKLPVVVHTGDPWAFFEPMDQFNERIEELGNHPDWHFYGPQFAPMQRLLDSLESIVARFPGATFVGAHFGCNAEDVDWIDRMFSTYPNFYAEMAARAAEIGRQPRRVKRLIEDHPTRVMLGTDQSKPTAREWETYFRLIETADEYFSYTPEDPPSGGRWRIYGLDLGPELAAAVMTENGRRILSVDA